MEIVRVRFVDGENGCENAPSEILKALKDIGSDIDGRVIGFEDLRFEEIHVDLAPEGVPSRVAPGIPPGTRTSDEARTSEEVPFEGSSIEESEHLIFENSKEIFERNFKAFFVGGDHSISYPIVRAFGKVENNPLLIVFDAHGDCLEDGSGNRKWLRRLIDSGFDGSKVILISGRNFFEEEIEFLKKNKVTLIKMNVLQEDLSGVCDLVMERTRGSGGFYVSIDIDSVDCAFAPGCNDLEPGGLSSLDLIYFIKRLRLLKNFRGGDIVEINPLKDVNGMTVRLGARLLGEIV
ncbi:hypothetical protein HOE04_05385 [archaeon]|jgi:arginase family enzyme|nr:hypothetical protein [archaeon]